MSDQTEDVLEVARAAVRYDEAIRACADDPSKMASFCTAEGKDLDALYADWIAKSRAALASLGASQARHAVDTGYDKWSESVEGVSALSHCMNGCSGSLADRCLRAAFEAGQRIPSQGHPQTQKTKEQ